MALQGLSDWGCWHQDHDSWAKLTQCIRSLPHTLTVPALPYWPWTTFQQPVAERPLWEFFADVMRQLEGGGLAGLPPPFLAFADPSGGSAPVALPAGEPPLLQKRAARSTSGQPLAPLALLHSSSSSRTPCRKYF